MLGWDGPDPVRSAASLLDLQSRDKEEAVQHRKTGKVFKDQMDLAKSV